MWFFAGWITGLLVAILIAIILVILKEPIERKLKVIYETIPRIKQKGEIIQPPSDIALAQEKIIEDNKKMGRDTKLSDIIHG